jgi:hypothetical protein
MKIKLAKKLRETLEAGIENGKVTKDEIINGGYHFGSLFFLININERTYGKSSATVDLLDGNKSSTVLDNNHGMHYIREIEAA